MSISMLPQHCDVIPSPILMAYTLGLYEQLSLDANKMLFPFPSPWLSFILLQTALKCRLQCSQERGQRDSSTDMRHRTWDRIALPFGEMHRHLAPIEGDVTKPCARTHIDHNSLRFWSIYRLEHSKYEPLPYSCSTTLSGLIPTRKACCLLNRLELAFH